MYTLIGGLAKTMPLIVPLKNAPLLTLLVVLASTGHMFGAGAQSRVEVRVTDAFGDPVAADRITVAGTEYTGELPQNKVVNLASGQYKLTIEVAGFDLSVTSVLVDQPEQIISIAMKLGAIENEVKPCSVRGRVTPAANVARMRIVQLFGTREADVPIAADGNFQFRNLECGDYIVIAMSSKKCLATKVTTARVLVVEPFEIKIENPVGQTCPPAKE